MKDLEANKIAAAILVAGLIALIAGKFADVLYHPEENLEKRGFAVAVAEAGDAGAAAASDAPLDIPALLAAGDATAGQAVFKKCAACHGDIQQGAPHKVGPNLFGIVGAKIGHHADFAYSDGIKEKNKTESWTFEHLFAFLHKPKDFVPGTKMSFPGLKDPKDIANVVLYLRSQGSESVPLPAATAKPAEAKK